MFSNASSSYRPSPHVAWSVHAQGMTIVRLAAALLPCLFLPSCNVNMILPSSGFSALTETPATVPEGRHAVALSGSAGGPLQILGTEVSVSSNALAYTYGLSERSDLTISPIVQYYGDGSKHVAGFRHRDAYGFGGDARYKLQPFDTRNVALYVGVGGVTNHYATFASASLGVTAGYTFEKFTPFVNVHGYVAHPFAATDVVLKTGERVHPSETFGAIVTTGLAYKFVPSFELRGCLFGVGFVASKTHQTSVFAGGLSAHYTF